jgi:ribonuclease Z
MKALLTLSTTALLSLAAFPAIAQQAPAPVPAGKAAEAPIVVTLLGTGTPTLNPQRFGYSTLVQAGGLTLVFDAGRGNAIRLAQLQVPLGSIDATFITHFHSDHLVGLPDLWATSFLQTPQNRRSTPFELYGPKGIAGIADGMRAMFRPDIDIRMRDAEIARSATEINVHEFAQDGVVFERNGVKVTAFTVDHGAAIKPAVGYRIDYAGHSVVLSGDTKLDDNVRKQATGADLLVHEVSIISTAYQDAAWAKPSIAHHASAEQAGQLFAQAKPRLAVFSHISRPGPQDASNTDAALKSRSQAQWPAGRIEVGTDLMRIFIGKDVRVQPWSPPAAKAAAQ